MNTLECKKLVIETNGTSMGTKIYVDDQIMGRIATLSVKADVQQVPIQVELMRTLTNSMDHSIPVGEIRVEPLVLKFVS